MYIIGHSINIFNASRTRNGLRGGRGLKESYSRLPTNSQRNKFGQSLLLTSRHLRPYQYPFSARSLFSLSTVWYMLYAPRGQFALLRVGLAGRLEWSRYNVDAQSASACITTHISTNLSYHIPAPSVLLLPTAWCPRISSFSYILRCIEDERLRSYLWYLAPPFRLRLRGKDCSAYQACHRSGIHMDIAQ